MTLQERLKQINDDANKYMAENPGSWSSGLTDDLNHWAGYGVYTSEQLDEYLDSCCQKEWSEYDYDPDYIED